MSRLFRSVPETVMMTINGRVVVPHGTMEVVDDIADKTAFTTIVDDTVVTRSDIPCPKMGTMDTYPVGDTTFRGDPVFVSARSSPIVAKRGTAKRAYSNFRNCVTIRTTKYGFRLFKSTGSVQGFGFKDMTTFHEFVDVACTALLGAPCLSERTDAKISLVVLNADIDKALFACKGIVKGTVEFPMRRLAIYLQTMVTNDTDMSDLKFDPHTRADVTFVVMVAGVAKVHVLMKPCGNVKLNISKLQKPLPIAIRHVCDKIKTIFMECLGAVCNV